MGDSKFCTNCKREIAVSSFTTHEVHCHRKITLCKSCNEPVPIAELDEHFEQTHKPVPCKVCGKNVEIQHMDEHCLKECEKRLKKCQFCDIESSADKLLEHQSFCGTRTEECAKCRNRIMLRDQEQHDLTDCSYPPKSLPQPPVRRSPRAHVSRLSRSRSPPSNNNGAAVAANTRSQAPNTRQRRQASPQRLLPKTRNTSKRDDPENGDHSSKNNNNSTYEPNIFVSDSDGLEATRRPAAAGRKMINSLSKVPANQEWRIGQVPADGGDTLFPCEFCSKSFSINQLFVHQSICQLNYENFDAEDGNKFQRKANDLVGSQQKAEKTVREHARVTNDYSTTIPCEVCGDEYPLDEFSLHQVFCESKKSNNDSTYLPNNNGELIPCEICGEYFVFEEFIFHQTVCHKYDSSNADNGALNDMVEFDSEFNSRLRLSPVEQLRTADEVEFPCEFCGEKFDEDYLFIHQSNCIADLGRTSRLDFRSNDQGHARPTVRGLQQERKNQTVTTKSTSNSVGQSKRVTEALNNNRHNGSLPRSLNAGTTHSPHEFINSERSSQRLTKMTNQPRSDPTSRAKAARNGSDSNIESLLRDDMPDLRSAVYGETLSSRYSNNLNSNTNILRKDFKATANRKVSSDGHLENEMNVYAGRSSDQPGVSGTAERRDRSNNTVAAKFTNSERSHVGAIVRADLDASDRYGDRAGRLDEEMQSVNSMTKARADARNHGIVLDNLSRNVTSDIMSSGSTRPRETLVPRERVPDEFSRPAPNSRRSSKQTSQPLSPINNGFGAVEENTRRLPDNGLGRPPVQRPPAQSQRLSMTRGQGTTNLYGRGPNGDKKHL